MFAGEKSAYMLGEGKTGVDGKPVYGYMGTGFQLGDPVTGEALMHGTFTGDDGTTTEFDHGKLVSANDSFVPVSLLQKVGDILKSKGMKNTPASNSPLSTGPPRIPGQAHRQYRA